MHRIRILGRARRALGIIVASTFAFALVGGVAAAAEPQDQAQMRKQLDEARARLDDAAREVADLSLKLYGDEMGGMPFPPHGGSSRGAMLGINIGGGTERADGVEIVGVSPAGPAATAGLRKGDVIVAVDGKALRKSAERTPGRQLVEHLRAVQPGQAVTVDYLRDGKKLSSSIKTVAAEPPMLRVLRERIPALEGVPLPHDLDELVNWGGRGFRTLELVPMTPKLGQYFGADKGLLVVKAPAAAGGGIEEGDVILTIGGRTPENPRHAFRILGSYQADEKVRVEVLRQRKRLALEVQLPDVEPSGPGFHPGVAPRAPAPAVPPAAVKGAGIAS